MPKNSFIAVIRILIVKVFEKTLKKNLSDAELSLKVFETTFSLTLEKFAP